MWNRQSPEVLYGSYYDGIVQHTISRRTSENSNILSAKVHASQGFDWRRLKIGASVTYSYYDSPLLVQNDVLRYTGNSLGVNADISLTPFKWMAVSYQGNYSQSATQPKGGERFPWLRTVTNKGTLDFTIPGGVTLTTSLYHYYNNFNYGDRSFLLLTAGPNTPLSVSVSRCHVITCSIAKRMFTPTSRLSPNQERFTTSVPAAYC